MTWQWVWSKLEQNYWLHRTSPGSVALPTSFQFCFCWNCPPELNYHPRDLCEHRSPSVGSPRCETLTQRVSLTMSIFPPAVSCLFLCVQPAIQQDAYVWAFLTQQSTGTSVCKKISRLFREWPSLKPMRPARCGGAENCLWVSFSGCRSPFWGSTSQGCRLCLCRSGF